jgi:Toprim domain
MASAATIGRNLDGWRQGANWRCSCPICDYPLAIADGEEGQILAFCHGGCSFSELEGVLVDYGLYDDDDYEALRQTIAREPDPEEIQRRVGNARWLYSAAVESPLIAVYLRSRSISIISPVLRLIPSEWHRPKTGVPFSAMAAPVTDITGEVTGIHLTFLKPDGSGQAYPKPEKSERDRRRQCHGVITGGAIRLVPHDPDRELIVAEGIESCLAAMEWFDLPGWSAVSAGGLKRLRLPPEIRRILIIADHDANGCSQRNAVAATRQWETEGRAVRIWAPETIGDDANDFLKEKRR